MMLSGSILGEAKVEPQREMDASLFYRSVSGPTLQTIAKIESWVRTATTARMKGIFPMPKTKFVA